MVFTRLYMIVTVSSFKFRNVCYCSVDLHDLAYIRDSIQSRVCLFACLNGWLIVWLCQATHSLTCKAQWTLYIAEASGIIYFEVHPQKYIHAKLFFIWLCVRILSISQPIIASFINLIGGQVRLYKF